MMRIMIPTYMREDNQRCYERLPQSFRDKVELVTHSGRAPVLKAVWPKANIVDLGDTDGIADVRQKLIDLVRAQGDEKVLIIDDGCVFKKRVDMKLVNMEEADYDAMASTLESLLDQYAAVGVSDQAGNNRVEQSVKEIGRMYSCYAVNVTSLAKSCVSFDGMYRKDRSIKLYEDFYLVLSLLKKGMKNAVVYDYAFSHPHGKKGGNSTIRTNELQKTCLLALQREFPGMVDLVKKEDPSWKAGLGDTDSFRWEARISWLDAYKEGVSGASSNSLEDLFG